MQRWHRSGPDSPAKAVADDHGVTRSQGFHEGIELRKVIADIGIGHDHESTASRLDTANQRTSVSLAFNVNDTRARHLSQFDRAIGRAVIRNQYLCADTGTPNEVVGLADTDGDRLRLIQAWHQDGQLQQRGLRPRRSGTIISP